MSIRDRLSPAVRDVALRELRVVGEMLHQIAGTAVAAESEDEWSALTGRLALLQSRLMAGEGGNMLVTDLQNFAHDYSAFRKPFVLDE